MLIRMEMQDFCCYKKASVDLVGQGLVWVGGSNGDTESATSNGSGKSTLFKALEWGLYGETIDKKKGNEVIREGAKQAKVVIDVDGGWQITRIRKKGSPRLSLTKDGNEFHGKRKDIQTKIDEILGMDYKTFKNTVLFGQNDAARFSDPSVKDTERKDMLGRLLGIDVIDSCYSIARAKKNETEAAIATLKVEINSLERALAIALSDLKECRRNHKEWAEKRAASVKARMAKARSLKSKAEEIGRDTPDVDALRVKVADLKRDVQKSRRALALKEKALARKSTIEREKSKAEATVQSARREIRGLKSSLERLSGDSCPICKSPLDGEHARKHIQSIEDQIASLETEVESSSLKVEGLRESIADVQSIVDASTKKIAAGRAASTSIDSLVSRISRAEMIETRVAALFKEAKAEVVAAKELRADVNPHRARYVDLKSRVEDDKANIEGSKESLASLESECELYRFWSHGFSGKGLPSYILDGVMPYLTERANHYLGMLSDGDISVEFNTQAEKKSSKGEYKDEITISWIIEGVADKSPSGGQQRKIEIATDLALMDLVEMREGARLDLFIADEILDGLDSEGVDRVLTLLKHLRGKRGSIFIISHQPSVSEVFEKAINVSKKGGVTTLEYLK